MTPKEAEILLADHLMERRSRAGSVLSDEQAQEVERLLSPEGTLIHGTELFEHVTTSTRRFQGPSIATNGSLNSSNSSTLVTSDVTCISSEFIAFKLPDRRVEDSTDDLLDNRVEDSTDDQLETGTDKVRQVKGKFSDTSIGSTLVQENVSSWLETTGNKY